MAGHDVYQVPPPALFGRHEDTRNAGTHIVWAGGPYDSHLLVPVIPAKEA